MVLKVLQIELLQRLGQHIGRQLAKVCGLAMGTRRPVDQAQQRVGYLGHLFGERR